MLRPKYAALLRERTEAKDEAIAAFEDAIAEAWRSGASLGEIARELGWSHTGVSNLLARNGVRKQWRSLEDANRELDMREAAEREARNEP